MNTVVTIPTFNSEEFLRRSIDSCLKQTRIPEVWVVDNCSTDSTVDIVNEYQKQHDNVKFFVNEQNLGRIGNWNRCLELFEKSNFEYIKFLFTGDELLPDCINKLEEIIGRYPDMVSISWPYLFKNIEGQENLSPKEWETSRVFSKEELVEEGFFPGNFLGAIISVLLSKKAILNNRFDEMMLGIVPFYDRVLVRGYAYYYSKPLSRFNLDSHRSFGRSLSHHIVFESAFAKANDLEINRDWIAEHHYHRIKDRIMIRLIRAQMPYFSFTFWMKTWLLLPLLISRKMISHLKRWLKPKWILVKKNQ